MNGSSYSNFDVREGVVSAETTITFNLKPRKIILINDSTTKELTFKFNNSETAATLKPSETIALHMASRTIILNGSNADIQAGLTWREIV